MNEIIGNAKSIGEANVSTTTLIASTRAFQLLKESLVSCAQLDDACRGKLCAAISAPQEQTVESILSMLAAGEQPND